MFIFLSGVGLIVTLIAMPASVPFTLRAMAVLSFLSLILGQYLGLVIKKRRFYRRNGAGIEEFKSFGAAFLSDQFEGLLSILSFLLCIPGFF